MIKNKNSIFIILILFLVVGFAAVATNLAIKGNFTLATNTEDFDVEFSSAILDGVDVSSSVISADGQTITFSSGELSIVGDESTLEYTVVNKSKNYDADVAMECTAVSSNYIAVTNIFNVTSIPVRSEASGKLMATLVNASLSDQDISVNCSIVADSVERTELGQDSINEDESLTFSMYGTLKDSSGNSLANQGIVIYSTPTYAVTDENGYFYVEGLTKGQHNIYVMGNKTVAEMQNLTEEEIKNQAVTKATFTSASINLVFDNGSSIDSSTIERTRKYTVTFDIDGGSNAIASREVIRGLPYGDLPTQTKRGYTFLGYYDPDDNLIESTTIVSQRKAHKIKAKYQANQYVVTLNSVDGKFDNTYDWTKSGNNLTKTLTYDQVYGILPTPTKTGFRFLGWYYNGNLIDRNTILTQPSNHILAAQWESLDIEVVANSNGGTISATEGWSGTGATSFKTITYGNTYGTLPSVSRTGYNFLGWYLSDGTKITSTTQMLQYDTHSITAQWESIKYTVTLNANGGSVSPSTTSVIYQGTYGELPTPTRTGYKFMGWYSGSTLVTESTINTNLANHTLTASWELATYTVTFNANGGSVSQQTTTVTYTGTYGTLPTPTYTDYLFLGWYTSTTGGTKITSSTTVSITADQTLFAQWLKRTPLNMMKNDNTIKSSSSLVYSSPSSTTGDLGLYQLSTNTAIYFYRGAVTNNNVIFANKCWRIIRTNDNGSIRMMYYGTPTSNTCPQIGKQTPPITAVFNSSPDYNAPVGYMFGTAGSSNYTNEHANNNNSVAKTQLENWYKTNLLSYASYISNEIFCNDRKPYSVNISGYTTYGYSSYTTAYGARGRLTYSNGAWSSASAAPSLDCANANDRFTASGGSGNNKLTYPIGLITADEVAFAGGTYGTGNTTYYLYYATTNQWTMSPATSDGSNAKCIEIRTGGNIGGNQVSDARVMFPVISLKADAIFSSGNGTNSNPYIVK